MKILYLIISLISFHTLFNNCDNIAYAKQKEAYKVLKIDSIENVFLIYLQRNDSVFKIMSADTKSDTCQKLVVDQKYNFDLESWFLEEEFHVKMRVSGVKYNGVIVNVERDGIVSDLFTTKNLNGLCYTLN